MQFFLGGDLSDRRKLHSNVSRELGVQHESLAVGLHDRTGQVVTIL